MSNPLRNEDGNDDRDGGIQKATPIVFEKFHSILEFWEARDLKAKQCWSKEKERHIRLEEEALKIKAAEDALMAAKYARKIFIEHRVDSSIKTESSAVEDKVIRKTTERPKRPREATALIRKNLEESNINTDDDDDGLPECTFSMDVIPYSPKERKATKSNRAKKWKERIAKKKNKKGSSKNANNQFETQVETQEERLTDNNPKNHLEDENAPLNTTIEEEPIPAFPEEDIVFHEGDAAKETVESISHDLRFSKATEQQSQSLSLNDTLSVHSTSTISTKYSSSASFSSFTNSSPARSRKREIEHWVHQQQSQSQNPSSSMDGTVCTASTISSTSIETNLLQRQESLLADDERSVDQRKTDGTGLQHTRLFHQHEDCVDDQQGRHDSIEYLSAGFDESGFDNYNDDEMIFPWAQPSQGTKSLSGKTDMQKAAQEDTFHATDAQTLMDHNVQHLQEELGYLEKEVYQLQEDLDICQKIAINWQQEAGLQARRNERLEQEMQKAMDNWEKSTKFTQEQQELEKTEEWKTTNGKLRRELANTQRQLDCLKFAYENIRGTHDMDLDICGDQLSLLSNKVQEQSIIISRLTKENDQLKKKRIFPSAIENKMLLCPSVVSSRDDNKDGDNNSECSSPSQRQSLSSLSSVRSLHEDTRFAYNQSPLEILETEEDSVGATITVHEEEEQTSLRLENAYLKRLAEISKTQIEELEAALEIQQAASSHQIDLIELDVAKSKETVVLLEEDIVRLKTESEAKVSHLREHIEAEKFQFEEEKERLLDRIIDLESNLMKSSAATTSFVVTDKIPQQESHIVHPMVGDGMMIEEYVSKEKRETAASNEYMIIEKQANAVDEDYTSTCSEEDVELGMIQNAYENIQMSLRDIEDDNECLRDRIVDLEDETRTKERHWENENEVLRDRIVDLETKLRDKEELLVILTAEANLF